MTAKEMFEKLGYEKVNLAPLLWQFNDGGYIKNIEFSNILQRISFSSYEYYNDGKPIEENYINISELKAINQQVKELGWIESEVN